MSALEQVEHVVLLMLENRSFDQMLGFLYRRSADFEGLDGTESNPDVTGRAVTVFPITPDMENAYYYPLANPSEGFLATNVQLFGSEDPPTDGKATNHGFVTSFTDELANPAHPLDPKLVGATPASIMGMYATETLPVLAGLAKGYAVCDRWYASVPTQTFPNRAFAVAGTALGYVDNSARGTPSFSTPSVFGRLDDVGKSWKIYGYSGRPLTANDFPDTVTPGTGGEIVSSFSRFQDDAKEGALASFSYIEPSWASHRRGHEAEDDEHNFQVENDQHPISNLAVGERLIYDVYEALRTGPSWATSLLIITYDEHGGNYDHVGPPTGATPPDDIVGTSGFTFDRFGVRVPTVVVSPLIPAGTILRAPAEGPPFDHTSVIATLRTCFGIGPLNARDAIAPDVGAALSLPEPRNDDPLQGVEVPDAADPTLIPDSPPVGEAPSSFLYHKAIAAAELSVPGEPISDPESTVQTLATAGAQYRFIQDRLAAWVAAGKPR